MPCAVPSARKSLLLLALALLNVGGAWRWGGPPPDPEQGGLSLSETVAGFDTNEDRRVQELRAFGSTGVRWLAYTVEYGRHPFTKSKPLPFDNAPNWLRQQLPEKWGGLHGSWPVDERADAVRALSNLRSEAAPAIPALVRTLENDGSLAGHAASALYAIGPVSWPAVRGVLDVVGRPY
jgi:hypothetical protein